MPLILLVLLACTASAAVRISEIMYDPEGEDNNKEFIELYSDEFANFSGYVIADRDSNDTLKQMQFTQSKYALVVEEGYDFSGIDASVYSAGASIGNNLGNEGDEIFLYAPSGGLAGSVSYSGDLANGNGKSLEFSEGKWLESTEKGGTPGEENLLFEGEIRQQEDIEPELQEVSEPAGGSGYESSSEKSKNLGFYLLLFLSVLMNAVLIWKR